MKSSSRFAQAIHILCYVYRAGEQKISSDRIAESVNVNAVTVRQVVGLLRNAALVQTHAGSGKILLTRDITKITLKDIFLAVENGGLLSRNPNPSPACKLAARLLPVIDSAFTEIEDAALAQMERTTLADIVKSVQEEEVAD